MQPRSSLASVLLFFVPAIFAQEAVSVGPNTFSGVVGFTAPAPLLSGQVIAGAPYSAEETETLVQTLADGTHITRRIQNRKLYRDSAGRTRVERPAVEVAPSRTRVEVPVVIEITDPVAHIRYTLDTVNKIAHKQAIPEAPRQLSRQTVPRRTVNGPAAASAEDEPQVKNEKLESQEMEGLQVAGTRRTTVYPANSIGNDAPITVVREDWRSPELKISVLHTENDPRSGEETRKLRNVVRADPDPSLFGPPADYSVVEEHGDFAIQWGRS